MKVITPTFLFLSSILVSASPIAQTSDFIDKYLTCELSSSSPKGSDIEAAVDFLWAKPDEWCTQTSTVAPFCSELASSNGATISICGPEGYRMECEVAAIVTWQIGDGCFSTDDGVWRVGGRYQTGDGTEFEGITLTQV